MKKLIHLLFCAYFISLILLPCGDREDYNEIKHDQNFQNNQHHQHETCTPFCICTCCTSPFVVKSSQPLENQIAVINAVHFIHSESKTAAIIIPIWQPPKLV